MWNIRIVNLFITLKAGIQKDAALDALARAYDVEIYKLGERASNPREILVSIIKDFGEECQPDTLTSHAEFEQAVLDHVRDWNQEKKFFDDVQLGHGRNH